MVRINDNPAISSHCFASDGSVVCDDDVLYDRPPKFPSEGSTRLVAAAIGEIRPTDVVTVSLEQVALHGGVVATAHHLLPAGLSAMWSR